MGSHDDLDVRVQLEHQSDELLLPFEVETDFRFVHEEHVRLIVLHQHGEEDSKYLLFAGRDLLRHELFAYLIEVDLVGCAHDGLARILEETVHYILEHPLRFTQFLCLGGCIRITTL